MIHRVRPATQPAFQGRDVVQDVLISRRAFLSGKMDLTQAEAVMDLISAQTNLALRAANEQLSGELGQAMQDLRANLISIMAHVEAYIDFPEEDIDPDTGNVTASIDLTGLFDPVAYGHTQAYDVLNGIAYDPETYSAEKPRLLVTGKLWPRLFDIELVEK